MLHFDCCHVVISFCRVDGHGQDYFSDKKWSTWITAGGSYFCVMYLRAATQVHASRSVTIDVCLEWAPSVLLGCVMELSQLARRRTFIKTLNIFRGLRIIVSA